MAFEADGNEINSTVIEESIGERIVASDVLNGFAANTVAALTLESGDRVVFKAASAREVEVEVWALRSMAERGVPTPPLLSWSTVGDRPHLITRYVSGQPGVSTVVAAARAGTVLRAVHDLPVGGVGFFKEGAAPVPEAAAGSWPDFVAEFSGRIEPLAAAGVLTADLYDRCRDMLTDSKCWAHPVVFVHGDFHTRHVLGLGTASEAIIDWADCGAAPVWLDLARMDVEGAVERAFLNAYFPSGPPPHAAANIATYKLLYALLALVWEYEGGGDWLHERVPGIEAALAVMTGAASTLSDE